MITTTQLLIDLFNFDLVDTKIIVIIFYIVFKPNLKYFPLKITVSIVVYSLCNKEVVWLLQGVCGYCHS